MPTSYTTNLGLALPVQGELAGAWGDVVNQEITELLDSAIAGTTTLSFTVSPSLCRVRLFWYDSQRRPLFKLPCRRSKEPELLRRCDGHGVARGCVGSAVRSRWVVMDDPFHPDATRLGLYRRCVPAPLLLALGRWGLG